MSELYISTSMGEYAVAAVMGSRRSFYHTEAGVRDLNGFFECFAKLKEEFPIQTLRKIFVEIGPGSFTGVRIGVTFARMLAQQLRIPLVPLRSVDIAAAGSGAAGEVASALLDTGNGFIYGAVYRQNRFAEEVYAVKISEWLDYVLSLGGKLCLCGRVSPGDAQILKNKNLKLIKLEASDIMENMIMLSTGAESAPAVPYGEVTPVYISRKQAEEKWQEKLEDEMVKISELVAKKEGVEDEITKLEKIKTEKEKEIEDINVLSAKTHSVRRELASSMDELSILNAKRTAYSESISAKEKKINDYEKKLGDIKSRSRDCERELVLRQAKYEKIKNLPPAIPREVELFIQRRDELKDEVESLKKEKDNYSREIDSLANSRFEEVFERIKKEEKMLDELSSKRRRKEAEIRQLEEGIREIGQKRAAAEKESEEEAKAPQEILSVAAGEGKEQLPEEKPEEPVMVEDAADETAEEIMDVKPGRVDDVRSAEEESRGNKAQQPAAGEDTVVREEKIVTEPLKKVAIENLDYMVRPFRIKDLPDVMRIEEASFERPWRRQMFKEELAIPVSKLYTLYGRWNRRDKLSLMAYSVFWVVSGKAHIINFAVKSAARNKGVGGCFLYEILKKASAMGCKSAYLEVRVSAKFAHRMLEKAEFSKTAERKDYFGYPKEDAFIYERKL